MKKIFLLAILTFSLNGFCQVPSYVPTSGLIAWWPFNGNANDESGNGNNGSIVGNTSITTDRFGNPNTAYSFDGNGDYIDCGNAPSVNITGSLTISAWIYASDLTTTRGILTKSPLPPVDDAYQLVAGAYVLSDLNFLNSDYGYIVPTLNWVHVVSVFDSISQTISLYTDGTLDTTISVSFSSIGTSADNLCLGTHRPTFTTNWSWSGKLDDMAIWNRPLTPIEITALYLGSNVGIIDKNSNVDFSIFPNPTTDKFTLKTSSNSYNLPFTICDQIGRQIISGKTEKQATTFDISKLETGIYFLQINGQNKQTFKIIKN